MKRFSILTQALAPALMCTLILNACGAASQVPPTISSVDLKSTIEAEAIKIFLATQSAIPTATATPSPTATLTSTPTATATLPVLPTEGGPTFTALPEVSGGNSGTQDPCIYQVMPASLEGNTIRIRIDNPTRSAINVSVYLHQAGPQSVCGYRGYTLAAGESLVINDLVEACYTIWAWNPDPDEYFMVTNGTSCLNNSNSWTFDISTSDIRLRP